ncbi:hypothetical protein [Pantoea stewartii]|uniref:hypothetical protein n=1 Tax=Pantoea stewartii TaxID=66269 RepID=UPI00345B74E1
MKFVMAVGMIKITRKSKLTIMLLVGFFISGLVEAKMQANDIWSFVTQMRSNVESLSVQTLHKAPMTFTLQNQNEYINFYRAQQVRLKDTLLINDIELRLSKTSDGMAPFFSFSPQGKCITLNVIKKHYQTLRLTDYPRGQSEHELISYTSSPDTNGQVITFSFTAKNPDCLIRVIITTEE